jgi:hypothetical protein
VSIFRWPRKPSEPVWGPSWDVLKLWGDAQEIARPDGMIEIPPWYRTEDYIARVRQFAILARIPDRRI